MPFREKRNKRVGRIARGIVDTEAGRSVSPGFFCFRIHRITSRQRRNRDRRAVVWEIGATFWCPRPRNHVRRTKAARWVGETTTLESANPRPRAGESD